MILKQEELISKYFEHRMSAVEEQDFLIKLAASDGLRIAFRSHLELMKAVRQDKDDLRSIAQVRNRTLAALGLSAAALTPFIEQELVKSARPEEAPATASWFSRLPHFLRTQPFALGTGLMLGFSVATLLVNSPAQSPSNSAASAVHAPASATQSAAPVQSPAGPVSTVSGTETNKPTEDLNSMSRPATSVMSPAVHASTSHIASEPLGHESLGHEQLGHEPLASDVPSASRATDLSQRGTSAHTQPVVTRSKPGKMSTSPVTIKKTNDSAKAN